MQRSIRKKIGYEIGQTKGLLLTMVNEELLIEDPSAHKIFLRMGNNSFESLKKINQMN
jgi:hypothetical protein